MIQLNPYTSAHCRKTASWVAQFYGFHESLVTGEASAPGEEELQECLETIAQWQVHPDALYTILEGEDPVGFVHLCHRGPIVAWIEDVFVDAAHRGRGIATAAIRAAEQIIRDTPGYQAVSMDVSLRNAEALALYHKLGYRDLSLVTVRKELGDSKRDRPVSLLGLEFRY